MADVRDENIDKIKAFLREDPRSINEIADKFTMNWLTVESILKTLKNEGSVDERKMSNSRVFFYKDKNNYFGLPVKKEQEKIIKAIYTLIKKFAKNKPTKTHAYKITWKVNQKFNLGLPIGWYKFGPCPAIVYNGDEDTKYDFPKNQYNFIKETTEQYTSMDNIELQKKIYAEEKNNLYLAKEELLQTDEKKPNEILMDLIKYTPKEAIETTTDFVRTVLLLEWNRKTRECFQLLWKYITIINHRDTLSEYYRDIDVYMKDKIEEAKKDAQLMILDLVRNHMDAKHSQESKYQAWKKKGSQKHS